ncbi:MAG: cyclic nucleotide-binding domain-containing protein [Lachnospiraceae bacterium]|nr:cyclic nucleotide-binding domain-containing protein [Lachnospiraceae bacterium]
MKINQTNKFSPGDQLFNEADPTGIFCLVLKGKVRVSNSGFSIVMGVGALLGELPGATDGVKYSCEAVEDVTAYVFSATESSSIRNVLSSNKDYCGVTVFSHSRFLAELYKKYDKIRVFASSLYSTVARAYSGYMSIGDGVKVAAVPGLATFEEFSPEAELYENRVEVLLEYSKISYEGIKGFYSGSDLLTLEILLEMINTEAILCELLSELSDYCFSVLERIEAGNGLAHGLLSVGSMLRKKGKNADQAGTLLDSLSLACEDAARAFDDEVLSAHMFDGSHLTGLVGEYKSGKDFSDSMTGESAAKMQTQDALKIVSELKGTYETVTAFAGFEGDEKTELRELLDKFIASEDRDSTDDEMRKLRRSLADKVYALYEKAMIASIKKNKTHPAVEMFLEFGLLEEKLLTEEELMSLVSISHPKTDGPCKVYTIREWLTRIYNGEEEPSRNDMGLDYSEVLREMKKQGKINDAEIRRMLDDGEKKLHYEIREVMFHGVRVVNGSLTTFVPVLHSGMMLSSVEDAYCDSVKINELVNELLDIDYSIFHREALFVDKQRGIEKEYRMKQVYPIFILYPTVGRNCIMWQEITGKKRDTQGRFFLPALTESSLRDMFIKAFGQFRWALCKTIQGPSWNNIQVHSLTSEYADYIQFYKKNRDLSEERKEKLKLQIQRGRNNLREIFSLDYEVWIKSEAAGAVKLNKVAREILATYCPFAMRIRNQVEKQPLYEEAFARFERERNKKIHELELRYKTIENRSGALPEELYETMEFYRDK